MDASYMVNRILAPAACCAVVVLIGVSVSHRRADGMFESSTGRRADSSSKISSTGQENPLTEDEMRECSRIFEEIGNAYSNRRPEMMRELFRGVSNKIVRVGMGKLDKVVAPLQTRFREGFWRVDRNLLFFATVPEFEEYINANIAAANMLGFSASEKNCFDNMLIAYDLVVYKGIDAYLRKFDADGNEHLARSARGYLNRWKEHLSSGQSLTRTYYKNQLRGFQKVPRWWAEDFDMKSKEDWIAYLRKCVLKLYEHNYGYVPKWLDEEFPLRSAGE